jgi:hypothetical protein
VGLRRRTAFSWPHTVVRFRWDGVAAGILALILLSPIVISVFYMAPGSFPPVFYNIDTAYFLEKVHGLAAATTYPPVAEQRGCAARMPAQDSGDGGTDLAQFRTVAPQSVF